MADSIDQRVSDLESGVNDLNIAYQQSQTAIVTPPATATTTSSSSSGSLITWLATPLSVQTDQGSYAAIAWTTFDGSSSCPGATSLILEVQGRRDIAVHGFCYGYARRASGSPTLKIYGSNSNGVDNDTEGNLNQVFVPSNGGRFDYSMDAGIDNFTIRIIGYLS